MSFQGVEFTPDMRKMVVNVKHYFDNIKSAHGIFKCPSTQLTASALSVSESTVKVIMAAYNKGGHDGLDWSKNPQRGRPKYSVEYGIEPYVR